MKKSTLTLSVALSLILFAGCGSSSKTEVKDPEVKTLENVNTPPVATFDTFSINKDIRYDGQLTATDADGDMVKYIIVDAPKHGTVVLHNNGCFTYTPDAGYKGEDSFSYKASDDMSSCGVKNVIVEVCQPTVSKSLAPSNLKVKALSATTLELTWEDNSVNEDGFVIYQDGKLVASVDKNKTKKIINCGLKAGTTYAFEVRSKNKAGVSGPSLATGTTKDVLKAPVAPTELSAKAVGKTSLRLTWKDNADNESGYEIYQDGKLVKTVFAGCHCVTISALKSGTTYEFLVKAVNKIGSSESNLIEVSTKSGEAIPPENHAPVADVQAVTMEEDSSKDITITGSDVDGDSLTYTVTTQPIHGALTGTVPNLTYTPDENYYGSDSFSFKVNDGKVDSAVAMVSITVNDVEEENSNHAPVATAQSITVNEDTTDNTITLSGTDTDGNILTYSIITQPAHGNVSLVDNIAKYTPTANYAGDDSFTFKVNDGTVDSPLATVSISVTDVAEPNQAPTAKAGADQSVTVGDSVILNGASSSDADGTIASYEWKEGASILSTNANFTKTDFTQGTHTVTLKVTDNDGAIATDTVVVTVNTINTAYECPANSTTESAFSDTFSSLPGHDDIEWNQSPYTELTVNQIADAFNHARANDSTVSTNLQMPSQTQWDNMDESERALYLINSERCARGIIVFEGIEPLVEASPAQTYAEYIATHRSNYEASPHEADGRTPWERLEQDTGVAINTNADFYSYAENIAYQAVASTSGYPSTVHQTTAKSVYGWMYEDKGSSYGHRHFLLSKALVENSGVANMEGIIGIGQATENYQDGGYYWTRVYTVLNAFDPKSQWSNNLDNVRKVDIKP